MVNVLEGGKVKRVKNVKEVASNDRDVRNKAGLTKARGRFFANGGEKKVKFGVAETLLYCWFR